MPVGRALVSSHHLRSQVCYAFRLLLSSVFKSTHSSINLPNRHTMLPHTVCVCVCVCVCVSVCVSVSMRVCVCTYTYNVYIYIYLYIMYTYNIYKSISHVTPPDMNVYVCIPTHTHNKHTHKRAHQDLDCRVCIHPSENRGAFSPPNLHSKLPLNKERRWERGVTLMTSERACS